MGGSRGPRLLPFAFAGFVVAVVAGYALGGAGLISHLGYGGVFLSALVSSAAMVIPVPLGAAAIGLGIFIEAPFGIPPFLLVGVIAGTGSALGEMTGYIAGRAGSARIKGTRAGRYMNSKMERWGAPAVFAFAIVPNPFLDVVGVAAGCTGMSARTFIVSPWPGKLINYTLTALLFVAGADFIGNL